MLGEACHSAQILNGECSLVASENLQKNIRPVRAIRQLAQVGKGLLRTAYTTFSFAQLITEGYEQFAVAFTLVGRKGQNAGYVVAVRRFLFLGEIAH